MHAKGLIGDPVGKQKSIVFTEQGEILAAKYFKELFGKTGKARTESNPSLSLVTRSVKPDDSE